MKAFLEFLNGLSEAFWTWFGQVAERLPSLQDVDQSATTAFNGLSITQWMIALIITCVVGFMLVRGLGSRRKA